MSEVISIINRALIFGEDCTFTRYLHLHEITATMGFLYVVGARIAMYLAAGWITHSR
jgi:hypothetical protein